MGLTFMRAKEVIAEIINESVSQEAFQMAIWASVLPLPTYIALLLVLGRLPNAQEIWWIMIPTLFVGVSFKLIQKLSRELWNRFQ